MLKCKTRKSRLNADPAHLTLSSLRYWLIGTEAPPIQASHWWESVTGMYVIWRQVHEGGASSPS
ncbi:hypothetical protein E2C01_079355 [Portunus trituberculatus]|uniref:Uncharacterized protein n=1 Tax=Portunus trituberculatus TaxID=210409 RepID=A0A5B7IGR4_PORTR|nr:hypothetical protein [Portunus trituberculatus]